MLKGPVKGHNVEPVYFDVELNKDKEFNFKLPSTHNTFIYLLMVKLKLVKINMIMLKIVP